MSDWSEQESREFIDTVHLLKKRKIEGVVRVEEPTNADDRTTVERALGEYVIAITKNSAIVIDAELDGEDRQVVMRTLQLCAGFIASSSRFIDGSWDEVQNVGESLVRLMIACGFVAVIRPDEDIKTGQNFFIDEKLAELFTAINKGSTKDTVKAIFKQFTDNVLSDSRNSNKGRLVVMAAHHYPTQSKNVRVAFTLAEVKEADLDSEFLWLRYKSDHTEANRLTIDAVLNLDRHRAVAESIDVKLDESARLMIDSVILPKRA